MKNIIFILLAILFAITSLPQTSDAQIKYGSIKFNTKMQVIDGEEIIAVAMRQGGRNLEDTKFKPFNDPCRRTGKLYSLQDSSRIKVVGLNSDSTTILILVLSTPVSSDPKYCDQGLLYEIGVYDFLIFKEFNLINAKNRNQTDSDMKEMDESIRREFERFHKHHHVH